MTETFPAPAPVEPTPPSRRRSVVRTVTALGAVAAVAGVAVGLHGTTASAAGTAQSNAAQVAPVRHGFHGSFPGSGTQGGSDSPAGSSTEATAAQQVGIVDITSVLGYQGAEAAGTGMVLTSSGEVLTNNHVINGATSITVTVVSTGARYDATVVGTDATDDVAVLQLDGGGGLATAAIGTDAASLGEAVTAVGNAGGTGVLTAATGSVTALDQSITAADSSGDSERLSGLIETDADVQAGDSGGPLYGAEGDIVGMDTAASSGGAVQAYAIPIATAMQIADQIEQGVTSATIDQGYPAFLGVSLTDTLNGVGVAGLVQTGPAAQAGLTVGSQITSVGGRAVASAADVAAALADHSPGDRVTVTWTDPAGGAQSATVVLGSGPAR